MGWTRAHRQSSRISGEFLRHTWSFFWVEAGKALVSATHLSILELAMTQRLSYGIFLPLYIYMYVGIYIYIYLFHCFFAQFLFAVLPHPTPKRLHVTRLLQFLRLLTPETMNQWQPWITRIACPQIETKRPAQGIWHFSFSSSKQHTFSIVFWESGQCCTIFILKYVETW